MNSQVKLKKLISDVHLYTHIDEESATSIMYFQCISKTLFDLEGAIEGGYERLSNQLGAEIIQNSLVEGNIPYSIKQRSISGYKTIEAEGSVKYEGFQGKEYTIRMLVIKSGHSIYQLQYMYPPSPNYTETADSIFNRVRF